MASKQAADVTFKVIVVGDTGVGKSALTFRFCDGVFFEDHTATLGVDFKYATIPLPAPARQSAFTAPASPGKRKKHQSPKRAPPRSPATPAKQSGKTASLQIWDTAGQEQFLAITVQYYRGCHGVVLCFDLTARSTFERLDEWYDRLLSKIGEVDAGDPAKPPVCDTPIMLIGCKQDLADTADSDAEDRQASPALSLRRVSTSEAADWAEQRGMMYLETSAKAEVNIGLAFATLAAEMMKRSAAASASTAHAGKKSKPPAVQLRKPPPPAAERPKAAGACC
jgi:Rab family protein